MYYKAKTTLSNRMEFDMRVNETENQSLLLQERIYNIYRVSIIVPKRIKE